MVSPAATATAIAKRISRFALHSVARAGRCATDHGGLGSCWGYRCICVTASMRPTAQTLGRETPSCWYCESTVRVRAVVDHSVEQAARRQSAIELLPAPQDLIRTGSQR